MALIVHSIALEAVVALRPLVAGIARRDKSLADQLRRAASSIVLNAAEAEHSDAGNARARFHTAAGSTSETRAALRLAVAWGYVEAGTTNAAEQKLDRVAALLWGLTRKR
jgi:four helix bundle protein